MFYDVFEILGFQRQTHSEHHYHQRRVYPAGLHPKRACGNKHGKCSRRKDDNRYISAKIIVVSFLMSV